MQRTLHYRIIDDVYERVWTGAVEPLQHLRDGAGSPPVDLSHENTLEFVETFKSFGKEMVDLANFYVEVVNEEVTNFKAKQAKENSVGRFGMDKR